MLVQRPASPQIAATWGLCPQVSPGDAVSGNLLPPVPASAKGRLKRPQASYPNIGPGVRSFLKGSVLGNAPCGFSVAWAFVAISTHGKYMSRHIRISDPQTHTPGRHVGPQEMTPPHNPGHFGKRDSPDSLTRSACPLVQLTGPDRTLCQKICSAHLGKRQMVILERHFLQGEGQVPTVPKSSINGI